MKKISILLLSAFFASSIFVLPIQAEEPVKTTVDVPLSSEAITCMQDALTTRDDALTKAYDTYTAAVKTALGIRTDALVAAWENGAMSEIKASTAKAWQTFKRSIIMARISLRKAKNSAWKEFRTTKTSCLSENEAGLDTTDVKSDAQL
jgi:hypothetical protein